MNFPQKFPPVPSGKLYWFETTPPVSGDILDSDSGREDPNSIRGYRDAEFEIPLLIDWYIYFSKILSHRHNILLLLDRSSLLAHTIP